MLKLRADSWQYMESSLYSMVEVLSHDPNCYRVSSVLGAVILWTLFHLRASLQSASLIIVPCCMHRPLFARAFATCGLLLSFCFQRVTYIYLHASLSCCSARWFVSWLMRLFILLDLPSSTRQQSFNNV